MPWRRETVPGGKAAQFRWWRRDEDAAREFEEVTLKMNTVLAVKGFLILSISPQGSVQGFLPSLS